MFGVITLEDTVKVLPRDFAVEREQAIENALNLKFANKVLSLSLSLSL